MASCSDDVVWQVINHQFCAFKITTPQEDSFCRNEYNVTGVCSRITCPLANSQYATVRNIDGQIFLYMKTAERSHLPNKWWQRVLLPKDYTEAQKQLDEHLQYWPERLVDRCKQRLTRLTEVQLAERRLAMQHDERHYTTKSSKVKRRESSRERKALIAAKLERAIERELLDRLKSGAYGDQPLNVDEAVWKRIMKSEQTEAAAENQPEEERVGEVEYVEDEDELDEDLEDVEDIDQWLDQASGSSGDDSSEESSENEDKPTKPQPRKRVHAQKPPTKKRNMEFEFEEDRQVARA